MNRLTLQLEPPRRGQAGTLYRDVLVVNGTGRIPFNVNFGRKSELDQVASAIVAEYGCPAEVVKAELHKLACEALFAAQVDSGPEPIVAPVSAGSMLGQPMREPVIDDLLRVGESMNVIATPKMGKSWMVLDLCLSIAAGLPWLNRFPTRQGKVLVFDNELHRETIGNRLPLVADALGVSAADYADRIEFVPLRGQLIELYKLDRYFDSYEPGQYRVIVLDAWYRFIPGGMDENDNGGTTRLYNFLDMHAQRLNCAFVLIHHASKGNQGGKAVTDVGAGAGAQARAADTHLVLREHEEPDAVVLDAAVRSWMPIKPVVLRRVFPVWNVDDTGLDPAALRRPERGTRRGRDKPPAAPVQQPVEAWTYERFAGELVTPIPELVDFIIDRARAAGLSKSQAEKFLRMGRDKGLIHRWVDGHSSPNRFASVPQPKPELLMQEGGGGGRARSPHTPHRT